MTLNKAKGLPTIGKNTVRLLAAQRETGDVLTTLDQERLFNTAP